MRAQLRARIPGHHGIRTTVFLDTTRTSTARGKNTTISTFRTIPSLLALLEWYDICYHTQRSIFWTDIQMNKEFYSFDTQMSTVRAEYEDT